MRVLLVGSSNLGYRLSKRDAKTPLGRDPSPGKGVTICVATAGVCDCTRLAPVEVEEVCTGVVVAALAFSSSSILLMFCVDPEAARILASSSTSAKLSCFTAAMEYAHTPTTNAAIVTPVMAFRALNGARARSKPGDIW